jgi:hypothetical protein
MIQVEGRLEARLIDVAQQLREIARQARSRDAVVFLQSTAELVEKFARKSGE